MSLPGKDREGGPQGALHSFAPRSGPAAPQGPDFLVLPDPRPSARDMGASFPFWAASNMYPETLKPSHLAPRLPHPPKVQ